jgi:hypothetical protein
MKAVFESPKELIIHAIESGGLVLDPNPPRYGYRSGMVSLTRVVHGVDPEVELEVVQGDIPSIMRIIGALADIEPGCLRGVS